MKRLPSLDRASRVQSARGKDPATLAAVQKEIAATLLPPDVLGADDLVRKACFPQYAYMNPFEASQRLGAELRRANGWYASNVGLKPPGFGKYNLLYSTPKMFDEVWRLRQAIDELGVSYWFFIEHAVYYWATKRRKTAKRPNRLPSPVQLADPEIVEYVLERWHDPEFRIAVPLFQGWDPRFDAELYAGDPSQDAARALIDQRIDDAKATGRNPAQALAAFVPAILTKAEAIRRYGEAMVEDAAACKPAVESDDLGLM